MTPRLRLILLVVLAVSVLFNIAFVVSALSARFASKSAEPAVEESQGESPATLLQSLNLTPDQQRVFDEGHERAEQHIADLRLQVREAREQLWQLLAQESPEPARLEEQIAQVAGIQEQVLTLVVQHMLWMRDELSPGQKNLFDAFVENRMCSCPKCDGGCLNGCQKQCAEVNSAPSKTHSDSECGCGH